MTHVHKMNAFDQASFLPFFIHAEKVGYVHLERKKWFQDLPAIFNLKEQQIHLNPDFRTYEERTKALAEAFEHWQARYEFDYWHEDYAIVRNWGAESLCQVRRGGHRVLGTLSFGIHLNGYQYKGGELYVWVAKRNRNKSTYPGQWDTFVAGGFPVGYNAMGIVVKEGYEEAGIPKELALKAKPVGMVTYRRELEKSAERDTMFTFDLEIPEDFIPTPVDGEVEKFEYWPVERLLEVVRSSHDFKDNCNLIAIDFLIRHGVLGPEDKDYALLVDGLHQPI